MVSNHACKLLVISNDYPKYALKWVVSSSIFQKFSGEGLTEPLPSPLPRFFSGFALGSGFTLNSQALRAFDSGFALDSRALRALDSGFALNFRLENLVWPPKNKFLDPPLSPSSQEGLGGPPCPLLMADSAHCPRSGVFDQDSGPPVTGQCLLWRIHDFTKGPEPMSLSHLSLRSLPTPSMHVPCAPPTSVRALQTIYFPFPRPSSALTPCTYRCSFFLLALPIPSSPSPSPTSARESGNAEISQDWGGSRSSRQWFWCILD